MFRVVQYIKLIAFLATLLVQVNSEDECLTPNNETAKCVSIDSCPVLLEALASLQAESIEFVRRSSCSTSKTDSMVCCGSTSSYIQSTTRATQQLPFAKLSRTKKFCGKQHSDDYFHSTNGTVINEYPWVTAFAYVRKGGSDSLPKSFRCSGSLINERYVLTTTSCVTLRNFEVVAVRLGEYHLNNDTDCTEDMDFEECSDPALDIGIEDIIVHPDFNAMEFVNDIALVKLNRSIRYTDYIRPICLPLPDVPSANVDDIVITSGWGTEFSYERVDVKAKTYSKLISAEECRSIFIKLGRTFEFDENRFCTLYLRNNTEALCRGDAGGPVMFSRRLRWHQEGIISVGPSKCSFEVPIIHTNVSYFLNWIEENID